MTETLTNDGERTGEQSEPTKWEGLQDMQMAQTERQDTTTEQYETELTAATNVLDDVKKFSVREGKVYSKETGVEETDEDTVLRVKTSRFLFNEAKARHDRALQNAQEKGYRFVEKGPSSYVDDVLEWYGFKDDGVEKDLRDRPLGDQVLTELVENGAHNGGVLNETVDGTVYTMFTGEKADLGKAMLERRLKQHGLEMTGFNMDVDTSDRAKDGVSHVNIKVDTIPITRFKDTESGDSNKLHHPAAEQLGKLETEIARAKKDGDEDAERYYRAAMKMAIERNRLEVSPEEWDKMDDAQKERFYRLKMKEEKALGDEDALKFWKANLGMLKK